VRQFYQRFYGLTQVTPGPKELTHATALLATYGEAKAQFLLGPRSWGRPLGLNEPSEKSANQRR
jgi:hypothetical protein